MKVRWGTANRSRMGFAIYGGMGCMALLLTPMIVGFALFGGGEDSSQKPTAPASKPASRLKRQPATQNANPAPLFEGIPFTKNESLARRAGFTKCWDQFPGRYCERERVTVAKGPPLTAQIVAEDGGGVTIRFFDPAHRAVPLRKSVERLKAEGWASEAIQGGEDRLTREGSPVVVTFDPWTTMGSFPTLTAALK